MTSDDELGAVPCHFYALDRDTDISGVSGPGRVAYAIEVIGYGALVLWAGKWGTVDWRPDMGTVEAIHGHNGATRITLVDGDTEDEARAIALWRKTRVAAAATMAAAARTLA